MKVALTIARYGLEEALRRRVFLVVLVLTVAYVGLYWLGADAVFEEVDTTAIDDATGVELDIVVSGTLFGLSMFGTLFLGTVLTVFLTLGAVRGDAERGLLQPLVVRPVGRSTFLVGRFIGAATVSSAYVLVVYACNLLTTRASSGGWVPDQVVRPALELAAAVVVIAAISLLGSVFLSTVANGIAVFMLFGAGLVAGLLGQIGDALKSETLISVAEKASWALPFEALYQDALYRLTAETEGLTALVVQLGPFGGGQLAGSLLPLWIVAYVAAVGVVALVGFARRDL